ncbi:MerR family transcriptional regulator [Trinickia diaoshuihuensis]|uniref:MerR family transcriptional regulator n=1 Tax=Trinickia diaoshuihuensis TaxID=2292265 RepID=UPI000E255BAB|nr:MerR family transcriptional regulator [Trinickia diaoshuihuensis]
MTTTVEKVVLPPIPAKRYFTIGEVSELCGVKPHVLRYWEQEFTQLRPVKRRGNRRYYQHHEVLLIRRIRELLYEQGFTINGARNKLDARGAVIEDEASAKLDAQGQQEAAAASAAPAQAGGDVDVGQLRKDLIGIIELLRR